MDPKRQRGLKKGQITKLLNALDRFRASEDLAILQIKIDSLEENFAAFKKCQDLIENDATDEELSTEVEERDAVEETYATVKAALLNRIKELSPISVPDTPSTIAPLTTISTSNRPEVRLPKINLPTFDGKIENFQCFYDLFRSSVHNNDGLSDVEKFYHLKCSLTGEALSLVQAFPLTGANYQEAMKLLKNRYRNVKLIINTHMRAIHASTATIVSNASDIKKLLDTTTGNIRALENMGYTSERLWDLNLIYLVANRLDSETRRRWEETCPENEPPTFQALQKFLEQQASIAEIVTSGESLATIKSPITQRTNTAIMVANVKCAVCSGVHSVHTCEILLKLNPDQRFAKIKEARLCVKCLKSGHAVKYCRSGVTCETCHKWHHSILHGTTPAPPAVPAPAPTVTAAAHATTSPTVPTTLTTNVAATKESAFLPVCYALARNDKGESTRVCVMLDSCSDSDYISARLRDRLSLASTSKDFAIYGIGGVQNAAQSFAKCAIQSLFNEFSLEIEAPILNEIAPRLPPLYPTAQQKKWIREQGIDFSEERFDSAAEVDVLISGKHFFKLLTWKAVEVPNSEMMLVESKLGWFAAGAAIQQQPRHELRCNLAIKLEKFWEMEEITQPRRHKSSEEIFAEEHYIKNTTRAQDGRFEVSLPFKSAPSELGNTARIAKSRLLSMERKMKNDSELQSQYLNFMSEYLTLGHMSFLTEGISDDGYYLPHHAISKPSSTTTKLRVVFDASAQPTMGKSLNQVLAVGPTLQPDLRPLLLRFRMFPIAIVADIEKMYRMILLRPSDAKYQRILWRFDSKQPIDTYCLNTVTYGTSSASYLAVQSLMRLADECESFSPAAAASIKENFYMDDWVGGATTVEEAVKLQADLRAVMNSAGFHLRKFNSSHLEALRDIPENDIARQETVQFQMENEPSAKTLGIQWHVRSDCFIFTYPKLPSRETLTKRLALSDLSKFFDPLGLCAPIITQAKTFLQELWGLKIDWDDPILNADVLTKYLAVVTHLQQLYFLKVPRVVTQGDAAVRELHGFCDASAEAYAAVLYLRTITTNGDIISNLLCCKTKVTPTQTVSIPRLELCAALLLARLASETAYDLRIESVTLWSDSTVVLNWLQKLPRNLATYIANRVAEIQNLCKSSTWRHVTTECNPADVPTRYITPEQLRDCELWWHGPTFLRTQRESWPPSIIEFLPELPEIKPITSVLVTCVGNQENDRFDIFHRYSSYNKLLRVSSYIFRFAYNCTIGIDRVIGELTLYEIHAAKICLVKLVQRTSFADTLETLIGSGHIEKNDPLFFHDPILDEDGVIRVGGRLENAHLPFEAKHPILLPVKHPLATLIVRHHHIKFLHAGALSTHNQLRQEFWLVGNARTFVRKIVRECVTCRRYRTGNQHLQPVMGQLPAERTDHNTYPFSTTGIDYAGPFKVKVKTSDTEFVILTVHVAVFVCFTVKAVHLEVVEDLTAESFLAALRRFTSRRGTPRKMASDNSTTFTRATHDLNNLYEFLRTHAAGISSALAADNIEWSFLPPNAPHMGGLWEAAVKSMKSHLKRVVGRQVLTFLEFNTLLVQIEGCLNCRPLTALPTDPSDELPLTPAHFLIGRPLHAIPNDNRHVTAPRSRWILVQNMWEHFWQRWSVEYLHNMQQRTKWRQGGRQPHVGEVVLIMDEDTPPSHWRMGRVLTLYPGRDGITRVVDLQTHGGVLRRPVVKLVPLIATTDIN